MEFPEAPLPVAKEVFRDGFRQLKRFKELEEENRKLKQMFADVSLDNRMLKDIMLNEARDKM